MPLPKGSPSWYGPTPWPARYVAWTATWCSRGWSWRWCRHESRQVRLHAGPARAGGVPGGGPHAAGAPAGHHLLPEPRGAAAGTPLGDDAAQRVRAPHPLAAGDGADLRQAGAAPGRAVAAAAGDGDRRRRRAPTEAIRAPRLRAAMPGASRAAWRGRPD